MRKIRLYLFLFLMVLLTAAAWLGMRHQIYMSPNKEIMPAEELFRAEGDEIALILDSRLQEARGWYSEGNVYLPLEWVTDSVNPTFYFDESTGLLLYTMPDRTDRYEHPGWIRREGDVWISLALVQKYTDLYVREYLGGPARRIFLDTVWDTRRTAAVLKNTRLHAARSIKNRTIRELAAGERVELVKEVPDDGLTEDALPGPYEATDWEHVLTEDGLTGYVLKENLTDHRNAIRISSFVQPDYSGISLPYRITLAWHQVTDAAGNKRVADALEGIAGVNVVSPTWFSLTGNEGEFSSLADPDYVSYAHSQGLQVWGLIDNFGDVDSRILLPDMAGREKLISGLLAEAERTGMDGINIDFELLPAEASDAYAQFLRELSVACRQAGLVLSVDVPNPASFNQHYRRDVLGQFVDYVINMGYDEHYAGGEMGSVSSYPFFSQGIADTLKDVPKEKLIAGLPLYTRIWTKDGSQVTSRALGITAAQEWADSNDVILRWDESLGQNVGELHAGGVDSYLWMEDRESLTLKLQAAEQAGLAGVACWKLGFNTPTSLWELLSRQ